MPNNDIENRLKKLSLCRVFTSNALFVSVCLTIGISLRSAVGFGTLSENIGSIITPTDQWSIRLINSEAPLFRVPNANAVTVDDHPTSPFGI